MQRAPTAASRSCSSLTAGCWRGLDCEPRRYEPNPPGGERAANALQLGNTSRYATTLNAQGQRRYLSIATGPEMTMLVFTRQRPQVRTDDHNPVTVRDANDRIAVLCSPHPQSNCNHGPLAGGNSLGGLEESKRFPEGTLYTLRPMRSYNTVVPFAWPNNTMEESEESPAGFGIPIQVASTGITSMSRTSLGIRP